MTRQDNDKTMRNLARLPDPGQSGPLVDMKDFWGKTVVVEAYFQVLLHEHLGGREVFVNPMGGGRGRGSTTRGGLFPGPPS